MVLGSEAISRRLDNEGGALINGISAFIKETLESSLAPFIMWGNREKMAICEPRSWPEPDTESASTLNLGFPASRTVRNNFFKATPVYDIFAKATWVD